MHEIIDDIAHHISTPVWVIHRCGHSYLNLFVLPIFMNQYQDASTTVILCTC